MDEVYFHSCSLFDVPSHGDVGSELAHIAHQVLDLDLSELNNQHQPNNAKLSQRYADYHREPILASQDLCMAWCRPDYSVASRANLEDF